MSDNLKRKIIINPVIKDDRADILSIFSVSFGHGTNNAAELRGVLHGLNFYSHLGFTTLDVETNSNLVVCWLSWRKRRGVDYWENINYFPSCRFWLAPRCGKGWEKPMWSNEFSSKIRLIGEHDLMDCHVYDPLEITWPVSYG